MGYKIESTILERIANADFYCDERAALSFEQGPHGKYKRQLEYPIRLRLPYGGKVEDSMWRKVLLVREKRLSQRAERNPVSKC